MSKMQQESLTVKFGGQSHQVEVQTFAYSVLNFATVLKEANKRLGGRPIDIHIKSPQEGSVLVELLTTVLDSNSIIPQSIDFIANIVEVTAGIYALHKFTSGRNIKKTKKEDGTILINLDDGSSMHVAERIYNIYANTPAISTGVTQHFAALSEDPAVSDFSVAKSDGEKILEVAREDFPRLAIKRYFESENTRTNIESANLFVYKVVFDKTDRKWEFYHSGNRISANILDADFFAQIDAGESFAKGDQLQVELQTTQVFDESVGTYVTQSHQVVKVLKHIKRTKPQKLPFDKKLD